MLGQTLEFTLIVRTNARPGTDVITFDGGPDLTLDETTAIMAIVWEKLKHCDRDIVHNFETGSGTPEAPNQIELWASGSGDWHDQVHKAFTEALCDRFGNSVVVALVVDPPRSAA